MVAPISVALDATPLVGNRSGIGVVTEAMFARLANAADINLTGFLISYSGAEDLASELPSSVAFKHVKFPARLTHIFWEKTNWPCLTGFDVVHGVNFVVPPSPKSCEVITIHDLTAWRFPELLSQRNKSFPTLVKRSLDRGAHVHVVSEFVGGEVEKYLGVESGRITVIPNGSPIQSMGNGSRAMDMIGSDYLLSVGTIEPRKDYPTLIAAMEHVWDVFPALDLVIAGARGWGADAVDTAIASSSRPFQIKTLGYVDDLTRSDLLQGAQLLTYPSVYEGFGLPLLEAMAAGLPVVATQIGAISEVAGNAAMLVPPKSDAALAAGIIEVLEDDEIRQHLKAAGRRRAEAFSWDSMADQLAVLYHGLVNK